MIEFRNTIYYFLQEASQVKISFEVRYQQSVKKNCFGHLRHVNNFIIEGA